MTNQHKPGNKECPLCMESLEIDDLHFFPCSCKYQVCRFCWNRIITSENGLCPACRKPYNSEEPASFQPMTNDEIKKIKRKQRSKVMLVSLDLSKDMVDKRVLLENLLFVMNLPSHIPRDEDRLKSDAYFGKYGTVVKVVINQNVPTATPQQANVNKNSTIIYTSAYVTYRDKWCAMIGLLDMNAQGLNGMRSLKVSFGTTKYCSQFLKGQSCAKKECMYYHQKGDDKASFTKEDMAAGKHTEYEANLIKQFKESLDVTQLPEGHFLAPKPPPKPLLECDIAPLLVGVNNNASSSSSENSSSVVDLTEMMSHLDSGSMSSYSSLWPSNSRGSGSGDSTSSRGPFSHLYHSKPTSSLCNFQETSSYRDSAASLYLEKCKDLPVATQSYNAFSGVTKSFATSYASAVITNPPVTCDSFELCSQQSNNSNSNNHNEANYLPSDLSPVRRLQRTISDDDNTWLLNMVSANLSDLNRMAMEEQANPEENSYHHSMSNGGYMHKQDIAPPPGFEDLSSDCCGREFKYNENHLLSSSYGMENNQFGHSLSNQVIQQQPSYSYYNNSAMPQFSATTCDSSPTEMASMYLNNGITQAPAYHFSSAANTCGGGVGQSSVLSSAYTLAGYNPSGPDVFHYNMAANSWNGLNPGFSQPFPQSTYATNQCNPIEMNANLIAYPAVNWYSYRGLRDNICTLPVANGGAAVMHPLLNGPAYHHSLFGNTLPNESNNVTAASSNLNHKSPFVMATQGYHYSMNNSTTEY